MRLTESMLSSTYLTGLNRNLTQIAKFQEQLSSNKRINRPSDDPVAIISSLSVRSSLRNIEQYSKNITDAQSWLTQSETAVMDLNDIVASSYELALQAASGTLSGSEKQSIAENISQLREYAVEIGNSRLGDKYIFGGFNSTTAPFAKSGSDVLYQGYNLQTATPAEVSSLQSQTIEYEIGSRVTINVGLNGVDIMGTGDDNLIGIMDRLITTLKNNGSTTEIASFAGQLKNKQDDVLTQAANIGGRSKRLELLSSRYMMDEFNYESLKSSIEDIDTAEIITKLKLAETVYEAALSIGSRVILPNLTEFLR